jgi:hypothetical protein
MFDIVAAHENQATAGIDGGGIEHLKARLTVATTAHERRGRAAAQEPQNGDEQDEGNADATGGKQEAAAVSPYNIIEHRHSLHFALWHNRRLFRSLGKSRRVCPVTGERDFVLCNYLAGRSLRHRRDYGQIGAFACEFKQSDETCCFCGRSKLIRRKDCLIPAS